MIGAMKRAAYILIRCKITLFHEYKIEVPVVTFSDYPMKMVRISAHAYNSMNDYIRLADAMDRILGG